MRTRDLFLGMLLLLAIGTLAWLIRPTDVPPMPALRRPPEVEGPVAGRTNGTTVPRGMQVEEDRAVLESGLDTAAVLGLGDPAPDFQLEILEGASFRLSEFSGRVVLLNFWATWCEPCRDEMPDLVMAQDSVPDIVLVGVSMDVGGREVVADFHETFPVDYPLLLDGLAVAERYGAHYVVPTTFVVGKRGRIVDRFFGALTVDQLVPVLRDHLQQVE